MAQNIGQRIVKFGKRERVDFSKIPYIMDVPDLIEIQKKSYEDFLQRGVPPEKRENKGLQAVFQSTFPISDYNDNMSLEFVSYSIGKPKYEVRECRDRDMTYAAPLKASIRLVVKEEDKNTGLKRIKDVKEQEVYLGELPLMTENGTFIINGAERVIVSQLHRSPGVSFDEEGKALPGGKRFCSARIIPYRGSWLEFEFDANDCLYVRIDRKRRFLASVLLRALGYSSDEDILKLFYPLEEIEVYDKEKNVREGLLLGRIVACDLIDKETGEVLVESNQRIDRDLLGKIAKNGIKKVTVLKINEVEMDLTISNTVAKDTLKSSEEALLELYRKLRPGDPPTASNAKVLLEGMFFNPKRYDLGKVGRYKLNKKLNFSVPLEERTLRKEDIVEVIRYLIKLKLGEGMPDDIDHLGNRRVRSAGELLENQFRIGLARMERAIRERMSILEPETVVPNNLVNVKPLTAAIKEFFGSSQLSQFMDQTNPLAELTHKRRLSALGPGGLSRERAGFEVRDVHYSHYGRICPIETPEGPNIGLIASLCTYARVNEFGFIETPYRKVVKGVTTDKIAWLSADVEDDYVIAQADTPLTKDGRFAQKLISARHRGEFPLVSPEEIDYMDVSPKQLVSVATSLIPFLEHDDANRALMGSNMQRQAVPLLRTEAPLIGTGMEYRAAYDSGVVITAKRDGVVVSVTADIIVIRADVRTKDDLEEEPLDVYKLIKFKRSNQDTVINQKPLVVKGERVVKGQVIADGPATNGGELALGQNVLVAFMPWGGYNFEDAILISERLVKEDKFTSIHIEEFECEARETTLGKEEITRDIPNVSEKALKDLDESGIIRIGAEVKPGDILVGKVTPKGETELTPEERLLRAIFGEKASDVRDSSLRMPPGEEGIVIDIKIFSAKEREGEEKLTAKEMEEIKKIEVTRKAKIEALEKRIAEEIRVIQKKYRGVSGKKKNKSKLTKEAQEAIDKIKRDYKERIEEIKKNTDREIDRLRRGDELPPGVLKMVKVYVATKRKISVGDKMAGRHGNKGVIAKILPDEDMPYLADGTPVEIVLNPLGVPSRMNVGQILETHLGWAAKTLGLYICSPVFDGAKEEEIKEALRIAGLPVSGKTVLYDGRTGEPFDQEVTVGYIYMMKLAHLVDDKIHARSIGPYSLITQQPLGGKAQFGGQRFGEMEVWALEAYGAAYTLQELLTVKSDDVAGRTKIYEAIVKGENATPPGIPESFNVLVKELQSLCLDVELIRDGKPESLGAKPKDRKQKARVQLEGLR